MYCVCDVIVICIIQREFICNNRTIAVQNQNIWILWSQYSRYLIISGAYQYYYYCVLSCLNMIVRLWGWSWSSKGHLCSTIIDIVCHPAQPCPVLTLQTTFQIHWIYNKLSVSGPDYFVTCVGLFILECLQFTFTFGKSTEFLVGNLKWLPIILTHLARSRTDFSALF